MVESPLSHVLPGTHPRISLLPHINATRRKVGLAIQSSHRRTPISWSPDFATITPHTAKAWESYHVMHHHQYSIGFSDIGFSDRDRRGGSPSYL